jgi:hypothetical protein
VLILSEGAFKYGRVPMTLTFQLEVAEVKVVDGGPRLNNSAW